MRHMSNDDNYIRYIDNITILTNVGEEVELPNPIVAHMEDGAVREVWVNWEDKPIDVSEELELIFVGRVDGYALDVLCSIQVGRQTDNPASAFPECIDQFGLQKRDIQTEDIPHIDDYQYFKAKIPRTLVEEYHLKQLREMVADQVILARDINHMRNAIIEIEKYIWLMQDQLDELFDRVEDLERRVTILEEKVEVLEEKVAWIEENMVVDARNIGDGEGLFDRKRDRILEFKSLIGENIDIIDDGDQIILKAKPQTGGGGGACGINSVAKSFKTCHEKDHLPVTVADGMVSYSEYFNWQMVEVKNRSSTGKPSYFSLMGVFGMGGKAPIDAGHWNGNGKPPSHGTESSIDAGRFLKTTNSFIFEMKAGKGEYSGIEIGKKVETYDRETESRVQRDIFERLDAYSSDVASSKRAERYGYDNENDYDPEAEGEEGED